MQRSRFSGNSLPLPDQGVTLPVTYDRNEIENQGRTTPENRRLGYARVSTYGQTLDAQLEQLRAERCGRIYREKVTGAHNDRRELLEMLKHLAPGDVVTVTRIDRLARSTFDLFAIVKQIVDAKAQFRSLAEPWADTGTSIGRLMIAVLGGLADVERDLIRTRTAEGRSRAQKREQHMGRPPKLTRRRRPRPAADGRRAQHLPNSRAATTSVRARFRDCDDVIPLGPPEPGQSDPSWLRRQMSGN